MSGKKDAIGDPNKPRLSLIPKKALWALGGALTYGETHYGTHNWRQGLKISFLIDAALRHINEFNEGQDIDEKSQNHHLGNAMANLCMAIELAETRPDLDDRYKLDNKVDENKGETYTIPLGSTVGKLPGGLNIVEFKSEHEFKFEKLDRVKVGALVAEVLERIYDESLEPRYILKTADGKIFTEKESMLEMALVDTGE